MSVTSGIEPPEAGAQPGEVLLGPLTAISGASLSLTHQYLLQQWLAAGDIPQAQQYPLQVVSAMLAGPSLSVQIQTPDGVIVEELLFADDRQALEAAATMRRASIQVTAGSPAAGASTRRWARVEAELGRAAGRSVDAVNTVVGDLRVLRYDVLFPIRHWIADRIWGLPWVQALLFVALCPIAISLVLGTKATVSNAVLLLGFYFAAIWALILYRSIRPRRFNLPLTAAVVLFTGIIGVGVLLIIGQIPPFSWLSAATDSADPVARTLGFLFGVGVPEELTKAAPVVFLALRMRRIQTPRDAAFFGGMSGLAFGVAEAVVYSLLYAEIYRSGVLQWGRFLSGNDLYGGYLMIQTVRLVSLPFLHCIWSSIAGYYIGLATIHPPRASALVVVGILTSAALHGIYDLFSGGWLGLLTFGISVLLFVGYTRSADEIGEALAASASSRPADE